MSDALLPDVKTALRVSHDALDSEISDLITAARRDLYESGISEALAQATDKIDPLVKRAIIVYCKAQFLANNEDAARYQESYRLMKIHMGLAGDYQEAESSE